MEGEAMMRVGEAPGIAVGRPSVGTASCLMARFPAEPAFPLECAKDADDAAEGRNCAIALGTAVSMGALGEGEYTETPDGVSCRHSTPAE